MTQTNILGIRNNNTIVPYTAVTKRTKVISIGSTGPTGYNPSAVKGYAYADSDGVWRLAINIEATLDDASVCSIVLSGITFPAYTQSISAQTRNDGGATNNSDTITMARADGGSDSLTVINSANFDVVRISADLMLAAKPSWADANMEGVTAVDVMIPFGQTGMPGEVITATTADVSVTSTVLMNAASISITAGKWQVFGKIYFEKQSGNPITAYSASISDTSETNNAKSLVIHRDSGGDMTVSALPVIFNLTTTTTIYLVGAATFPDGTTETQGTNTELYAVRLASG